MADVRLLPVDRFGLIRRADALAADWSDTMLAAAVRSGDLLRPAPGVFLVPDDVFATPHGGDELHRLRAIAVVSSVRDQGATTLSHQSAAAVHGLPLLKPDQRLVHVTRHGTNGGGERGYRKVHALALPASDVVVRDGIMVTSLERTAADIALTGTFAQALTAIDGALRAGASRDGIAARLQGRRSPGSRIARAALAHADPLAESVGESWSRAEMIQARLALPVLQCEHRIDGSTYRCDFDWRCRLVGEFDGLHKYGRFRRPGESVADAVLREKKREDALTRAGVKVVRWVWADLEQGRVVPMIRAWLDALDTIPALSN
ncbi:type IV toxin-antitoxin system AbiEi family antitoxin domain-containing protein [Gordonia sp. HY442]|uniref:type IV toxin-antitoxin system AbiEi family antitoxin domain-containing protein n=1 Tax=Gordonia zhenghanii TaxID=2911516 RepID=UPI001F369FCB|nr:type IV toxin-antitoxin system AbiEi family antitoxin domain-containing protein [Gordonia zhenghanii]MCF8608284.1 type IV toxin-antitoxin system AbiEi family antitoxin domain-containing protein [Gordonia zhenghanii]